MPRWRQCGQTTRRPHGWRSMPPSWNPDRSDASCIPCATCTRRLPAGCCRGCCTPACRLVTRGWWIRDPMPAHAGHTRLRRVPGGGEPVAAAVPVDRALTFDKLTNVHYSGTRHDEDQPSHLLVQDTDICRTRCREEYGNPCTRFCPASVYEMVDAEAGGARLQINASNCVHCKTCDIMDPYQIIDWVPPEEAAVPATKACEAAARRDGADAEPAGSRRGHRRRRLSDRRSSRMEPAVGRLRLRALRGLSNGRGSRRSSRSGTADPRRHVLLAPSRHRRDDQREFRRRVDRAHHRAIRIRHRPRVDVPRRAPCVGAASARHARRPAGGVHRRRPPRTPPARSSPAPSGCPG